MGWETLQPYVSVVGNTRFALWIGQSTWRIAGLLTVHLFGLTLLLGSVLLSSLNLLGLFQRVKPAAQVRREMQPVMMVGLALMAGSGLLIFMGGAEAYYAGFWFRLKMVLFATAVTFQFTVNRTIATAPAGRFSPAVRRITGLATLMLWFGVGCAGRAIAFF
jgi:hypothetical protein